MEAYVLTFPAFIILVGTLVWFLVKRQIDAADKVATDKDGFFHKKFEDHEKRMNQHGDRLRETEIQLEKKITKEDLKELRQEFKEDFQNFQTAVLAALASRG